MGRILCLDYGTSRIGVAISDAMQVIASPLKYIPARDKAAWQRELASLCRDRGVERIVVGLPKNMNNTEGDSSKQARAFGEALEKAVGLPVEYFDERLTTMAAERILIDADLSRKKRKEKIDSMAAAIILQDYLSASGLGTCER